MFFIAPYSQGGTGPALTHPYIGSLTMPDSESGLQGLQEGYKKVILRESTHYKNL